METTLGPDTLVTKNTQVMERICRASQPVMFNRPKYPVQQEENTSMTSGVIKKKLVSIETRFFKTITKISQEMS